MVNCWILKSEPDTFSFARMEQEGHTWWEGVRNYQAQKYMKFMQAGDEAFFYHSNQERAIVGMVEIVETFQPDPTDHTGRFGMVGVRFTGKLLRPVTLTQIKTEQRLTGLHLVRQPRLSVMPVTIAEREVILKLATNGFRQ